MSRRFFKSLFLTIAAAMALGTAHAVGTIQWYGDSGIYFGPTGTDPTNFLTGGASVFTMDSNYIPPSTDLNLSKVPEGKTVIRAEEKNVGFGFFSIANVPSPGASSPLIPRSYPGFNGGSLRFQLNSTKPLTVQIHYMNSAGQDKKAQIGLVSTGGKWTEIVLPFSKFNSDGDFDFETMRILEPFIIVTAAPTVWYVDDIRYTKSIVSLKIFPPSLQANAGSHRQVTVEGVSSNGDPVQVYSAFTIDSGPGSITPSDPNYVLASTFTAGASGAVIKASALNDPFVPTYIEAKANVALVSTPLTAQVGIYSETLPGLIIDTDSKLVTFQGGGAAAPVLTEISGDAPEGRLSLQTVISQNGSKDFSGWSVIWGNTATSPDSFTRDMSDFYDGSLRFWIKGGSSLKGNFTVGIRSGNVPAGKELSKIDLTAWGAAQTTPVDYFDNLWHPVSIPISVLARQYPWADISRTKNFVSFSVVGAVSGPPSRRTFIVDNVRWDTSSPGPITSIVVSPSPITIPLNSRRQFTAYGVSATGIVDISPTWSFPGPTLGSFIPSTPVGPSVILQAAASAVSGTVRATFNGLSADASVTVAPITYTQSFNVYSDAGAGGFVGTFSGGSSASGIGLSEPAGGVTTDPKTFMHSTFTVTESAPGAKDGFSGWYVQEVIDSRYMQAYSNGYLHFWVRTTRDLQVSIRSLNITAGTEKSKFTLSELGIPLDGNWQEVLIALADFKSRESNLRFDQIVNYFTIAATSKISGDVTNSSFDIDDVKWLTSSNDAPDENKVYQGLKDKQRPSGLVRSFENSQSAFTYDQALAAMAFTYKKDTALSAKIFDVYAAKAGSTFNGFADEYDVDTLAVRNGNRLVGPNAWMLLALIHYRNVTGLTTYDTLIDQMAAWIASFIDTTDGAVRFGAPTNSTETNIKATEHNFDAYAAFTAYSTMRGSATYRGYASRILTWLRTAMWNSAQNRFNVGTGTDGVTVNTDRALDCYSWAPLSLSSYTATLAIAVTDFENTSINASNGAAITGFDFSGCQTQPVDKDAVWLEGTAQMVLAYYAAEDSVNAAKYLNELRKAVFTISPTSQGLTYATRGGTMYLPCGPTNHMDSTHAAVSSMVWYIFAERNFNPFKVFPLSPLVVANVSNNNPASQITWGSPKPGDGWKIANQYVKVEAQGISIDPWGLQIYTDNTNVANQPRYVDPTPLDTQNPDSDPSGLLMEMPTPSPSGPSDNPTPPPTTSVKLPFAWSIKDKVVKVGVDLVPANPDHNGLHGNPSDPNAFQWLFLLDKNTPAVDRDGDQKIILSRESPDTQAFVNGLQYARLRKSTPDLRFNGASHYSQDDTDFFNSLSPEVVYFEADFSAAAAQTVYRSVINFEFFTE